MLLDLKQLKTAIDGEWTPCGGIFDTVADFGAGPVVSTGPFVGQIALDDAAGHALSIAGALVTRVKVVKGQATISLRIPSPVPGYCAVDSLSFDLQLSAVSATWQVVANGLSWFSSATGIAGSLDDWLRQSGEAGLRMNTTSAGLHPRGGFPLDQLGVSTRSPYWTSMPTEHRGWLGLFRGSDDGPMLVFLPTGTINVNTTDVCGGLRLFSLERTWLGQDAASQQSPLRLAPALLSYPLGVGDRPAAWRAIVQWTPLTGNTGTNVFNSLVASEFIGALWNDPARAALRGARVSMAGQPLVPLPTLDFQLAPRHPTDPSTCPLLVFEIPSPARTSANSAALLRRVHLAGSAPGKVVATFGWQSGPIGFANTPGNPSDPGPVPPPLSLQANTIVFEAPIPQQSAQGWTDLPDTVPSSAFVKSAVDACAALEGSSELLFELDLIDGKARLATGVPPDTWLAWGSLEVQLPPSADAHLLCRLRGQWKADRCDLYPESDLTLSNCLVRVGTSADLDRDLHAGFDTLDAAEDARQRETDLLRHALHVDDIGIVCDVRIRYKTESGRNAVTHVEIYSQAAHPTLGSRALALQIRPFMVALTEPPSIDSDAGELIATWASDDETGAQWRVPDSTVECMLPPSVGEAMERGVRFWGVDVAAAPKSLIDGTRVLPFRFSPPMSLTVKPSLVDRRYNRAPSNIGAVLREAKVTAFVAEIAYPVQMSFKVSEWDLPDIRIAETETFLGRPAPNLPVIPTPISNLPVDISRWRSAMRGVLQSTLAGEPAYYGYSRLPSTTTDVAQVSLQALAKRLDALRAAQTAVRSSFVARLAEHHLMDPWRSDHGLRLSDGIEFRIRDVAHGAPPLSRVLPQWELAYPPAGTAPFTPTLNVVELTQQQKAAIHGDRDLGQPTFLKEAAGALDWGDASDGAISAGVIHTIEFPSELVAVLRNPVGTEGSVDALAFTPLGATGSFRCAFDEGRTIFVAESQHGQLSRLVKIRIGRVAVLWNKARHVIVYERSTVPSLQFGDEQEFGGNESRGWPILRKTEEYIEPIEVVRSFDNETQGDQNVTAFVSASEFVSNRIYVNGAWGRDLGFGYELPLWNLQDTSGFYPKPLLALQVRAGGSDISRCWHSEPHTLFFYSSTQTSAGADPDRWAPMPDLDGPRAYARLPVLTNSSLRNDEILGTPVLSAPRPGGARRPRFDFAVMSDGKADLQHGRGSTQMLAALDFVSMARTGRTGLDAPPINGADWLALSAGSNAAAAIASADEVEARADALISKAVDRLLSGGGGCQAIRQDLFAQIDQVFDAATAAVMRCQRHCAIPALPQLRIARGAVDTLSQQVCGLDAVLQAPVLALRDDIARLRRDAKETLAEYQKDVIAQLGHGRDFVDAAFVVVASRLADVRARISSVRAGIDSDAGDILGLLRGTPATPSRPATPGLQPSLAAIATILDAAATAHPPTAIPDPSGLAAQLANVRLLCDRLSSNPVLGDTATQVGRLTGAAQQALTWGTSEVATATAALLGPLQLLVARSSDCVTTLELFVSGVLAAVDATANDATTGLDAMRQYLLARFAAWRTQLGLTVETTVDQVLVTILSDIDQVCAQANASATAASRTLIGRWRAATQAAFDGLGRIADDVDAPLNAALAATLPLAASTAALVDQAAGAAANWLATAHAAATHAISLIDCAQLESSVRAMETQLRAALQDAEGRIRARVTALATQVIDQGTQRMLRQIEDAAVNAAGVMGTGIKLVKAIGELPALPTLDFNTVRAEYVFDDLQKQIETSPFAAKLREIDAGLKELGLAVPARALCDQIVPDLGGLDFNTVFRNFGGMDFDGLFKGLQLPALDPGRVQITHGVDEASRSAWVRANVNVDLDGENSIFEVAGLAVRMASMKLRARSDARVGVSGERRASTDASLNGDWGLDFGGSRLATFRDVTVRYDGSSFKFDISPDKIELNPALKFVSDLAKTFTPDLPPSIELISDARGLPIGARASMSITTPELSLGAVALGPMLIVAGLSLQMRDTGQFVIATHVSVGTKTAPIWVQIGYLGGGLWLEAQASFEGTVHYGATLGLAIGSMRALDIAGIARGSYSLLLFADAEIDDGGGGLRAGFSMAGSARILGIANASVFLLLEVVQQNGGHAQGHGVLEVSVDLCWCYTVHVRKQVQQAIGG